MSNPQIPNPDQLEFIHPKANPRTNPARYEDAPPDQLAPPVPTITIGPNAVYLVQPGYWDEKAEEVKPGSVPVLSSLEPNTLPVWAQDTEVFFNGSNFTEASVIIWNNGEEPTKFISPEKLSTIVKPSTVQAPLPFTMLAWVATDDKESGKLTFTFIT